jgi:hypothetical protein
MTRLLLTLIIAFQKLTVSCQWFEVNTDFQNIKGLSFCNDSTGLLMGLSLDENGQLVDGIYKTTDFGSSWTEVYSINHFDGQILDVYLVSEDVGFFSIVFYSNMDVGNIYSTVDGGNSWFQVNLDSISVYGSISFYNSQVGFATSKGNFGSTVRSTTTDGGANWNEDYSFGGRDIHIRGECIVWMAGGQSVSESQNCGGTWSELFLDTESGSYFKSISACNDVVVCGGYGGSSTGPVFNYGLIARSISLSDPWEFFHFDATIMVNDIAFSQDCEGVIVCSSLDYPNAIMKTWDGGESWHYQEYPLIEMPFELSLGQISCPSSQVCYASGGNVLLRTFNGGGPSTGLADYTVSTIETAKPPLETQIFPNPASAQFTLSFTQALPGAATLTATDITGRQIARHHIPFATTTTDISIHTWPPGLYVLRIETGEEVLWEKIVVE